MDRVSQQPCNPWLIGFIAGAAALALYAATCCRGVNWQDSGVHQYRVLTGQVENPYGLALSHPVHHWIGRAVAKFSNGHAPFALNLMSSFFGAAAVGLIAALVANLTGRWLPAVIAAMTTGLAHAFWQMSVLTETYTLQAALLALEWCILLAYCRSGRPLWLVLLFGVNGLHVANHLLGLLALSTYGVLMLDRIFRRRLHPAWLPAMAGLWLLGAAPYLVLVTQHYLRTGELGATLASAFFGVGTMGTGFRKRVLNWQPTFALLSKFGFFFAYSFPSLAVPLAIRGIVRPPTGLPRPFFWVLVAQTAVYFVFVARYQIEDIYTFFLPVCALIGVWVGLAADGILRSLPAQPRRQLVAGAIVVSALLPLAVYVVFPALAERGRWLDGRWSDKPFREEYSSFFHPWKHHDDSAERFARAALARATPGCKILADATSAYPIAILDWEPSARSLQNVAIYCGLDCVNLPDEPRLSPALLRAFLKGGGKLVVVPSPEIDVFWSKDFVIDKQGDWWGLRLPPTGAAAP